MNMQIEEAQEIVADWSKHLEFCGDKLHALFTGSIPESLLPYPIEKLVDALNVVAEHYHNLGEFDRRDAITDTFGHLALYSNDDDALKGAALKYARSEIREVIITNLKAVQDRSVVRVIREK